MQINSMMAVVQYSRDQHFTSEYLQPGTFWDGSPKGKEMRLGGLEAYVAEGSQASGRGILLVPDVFGENLLRRTHLNNSSK